MCATPPRDIGTMVHYAWDVLATATVGVFNGEDQEPGELRRCAPRAIAGTTRRSTPPSPS